METFDGNKKLKILYVLQLLLEESDAEHPKSTREIINYLNEHGISAERKSIYSDLSALQEFGIDIVKIGGQNASYYIGDRCLQLVEAKIIIDAICTSRFLTPKKTQEICNKISLLVSKEQREELQRNVYVMSRVKTKSNNEQIYYNIDKIQRAINGKCEIKFIYTRWEIKLKGNFVSYKEVKRNDGNFVYAFPIAVLWDDENYYLLAYEEKSKQQKHYRLDRMMSIDILGETNSENKRLASLFEPAKYSRRIFDMYSGEDNLLSIAFKEDLITPILDRFGQDITVENYKDGWFKTRLVINVSDRFFAWVTGFGGDVLITDNPKVVKSYKAFLNRVAQAYEE